MDRHVRESQLSKGFSNVAGSSGTRSLFGLDDWVVQEYTGVRESAYARFARRIQFCVQASSVWYDAMERGVERRAGSGRIVDQTVPGVLGAALFVRSPAWSVRARGARDIVGFSERRSF